MVKRNEDFIRIDDVLQAAGLRYFSKEEQEPKIEETVGGRIIFCFESTDDIISALNNFHSSTHGSISDYARIVRRYQSIIGRRRHRDTEGGVR